MCAVGSEEQEPTLAAQCSAKERAHVDGGAERTTALGHDALFRIFKVHMNQWGVLVLKLQVFWGEEGVKE